MKKKRIRPSQGMLSVILLLTALCGIFSYFANRADAPVASADAPSPQKAAPTIVLDAGHGGEDGGAVSDTGVMEKNLNLSLTLMLKDMLVANGYRVILTRESDTLLYDKNSDYEGRKKALDLAARKQIAEETPNCLFVSIHMNTYPLPTCTGLQVWYSPNNPASLELARALQSTAKELLQPENDRAVKAAGSSIYLLHNLATPAVLIECGFLSTPEEAELLASPAYQKQLAFTIFCGLTEYLAKE